MAIANARAGDENLPEPKVIAAEIIENLKDALEQFEAYKRPLKKNNWRRGWDSNPWAPRSTSFQDWRRSPLGYPDPEGLGPTTLNLYR